MGFDDGHVILNNKDNTYRTGETIYGKLEFQQDKIETFRGIYAKFTGLAHVHWTTRRLRKNSINGQIEHYTHNHDAYEDYLSMKQFLIGSEYEENHLQPGNHTFNFEFIIPKCCPSSFEHKYGNIRYEIKIIFDRASKGNKEKKIPMRVISPLDLNQDPYSKEPIAFSIDDTYSCCCISSGFSEVIVKLPLTGYCPEQIIPVELLCSNNSSVEIKQIKLAIIKKIKFIAKHGLDTKYDTDQIMEISKGPIGSLSTKNWIVDMKIPSIDIYNFELCRIIDIEYEFKTARVKCLIECKFRKCKCYLFLYRIHLILNTQAPNPVYPLKPGAIPIYPGTHSPDPIVNLPYPATSPFYINANSAIDAKVNLPYPAANPPYPITDSRYTNPNPGLEFRVQGIEQSGSLSPISVTSVIVAPSAPEPSTPDDDKKPGRALYSQENINTSNYNHPYNPEFMNHNK